MRVSAQMPSQRECVLPERQTRLPVKKVANVENERPLQWQPDTERYLLQIDRSDEAVIQDVRSFASHGTGNQSPVSNSAGLHLRQRE